MNKKQRVLLKLLSRMGDVILVRENGNRLNLSDEGKTPLRTQLDATLYFLQRFDIEMLKLILEDNFTYQDYDKKTFLRKLSYVFDEFQDKGNNYLNVFEGNCNSSVCTNLNCKGFSFVGNKTNHHMDLIIEIIDNKVCDIYECYDFQIENDTILKSGKITIDSQDIPF
jgi:hypothetical protein